MKANMFSTGIEFFICENCQRDRDKYTFAMQSRDGYRISVEQFYKATGRLTVEERDPLFNEGKLPEFAITVFRELELRHFGIDLISYR